MEQLIKLAFNKHALFVTIAWLLIGGGVINILFVEDTALGWVIVLYGAIASGILVCATSANVAHAIKNEVQFLAVQPLSEVRLEGILEIQAIIRDDDNSESIVVLRAGNSYVPVLMDPRDADALEAHTYVKRVVKTTITKMFDEEVRKTQHLLYVIKNPPLEYL